MSRAKQINRATVKRYSVPLPEGMREQIERNAKRQGCKPNELIKRYLSFGLQLNNVFENPQKFELTMKDDEGNQQKIIIA